MDQLVGFLLHPPLSEIGKKIGKMLKYTPQFQSAFGTAEYIGTKKIHVTDKFDKTRILFFESEVCDFSPNMEVSPRLLS